MPRDPEKLKKYRADHKARKEAEAHKRGPKGRPEEEKIRKGAKTWGIKLARKRRELGYTQVQMAKLLSIGQPTLSNLEKGTYGPSPLLREKIDRMFFDHVGLHVKKKHAPKP